MLIRYYQVQLTCQSMVSSHPRMRKVSSTAILVLAIGLLFIGGGYVTNYAPAAKPVLGPDGAPVYGPDGKPLLHRDMAKYYRLNRPAFILMGCSGCLFGWWVVRASRHLYACYQEGRNAS